MTSNTKRKMKLNSTRTFELLLFSFFLLNGYSRGSALHYSSCNFNSMCSCLVDSDVDTSKSISCLSVPLYKFPSFSSKNITHLEVLKSEITSIEPDSLLGYQVHELILSNNNFQRVMDRALSSMKNSLVSLDLSYNKLDAIPFGAFRDLRNLQWLNLHRNQISSILGDWAHVKNTLANLFLGENDITELSSEIDERLPKEFRGFHQFKSLIWLNLDGNKLSKIYKHSLPVSLQTLSVSHNLIENFPLDSILTLPRLQWLYLRGNHIESLPDHKFESKLRLEKIDLGENDLRTLPRLLFNTSVYVRDLNLAFNDLHGLIAETFLGVSCRRIILSYNKIETIDYNAFSGIEGDLEYLDLDHNRITQFPPGISYLSSLKYLYLSSNSLTEVPDNAFANCCSTLKAISFSGNRINKIPSAALQNCTKISHFNFAYNDIYDIDENTFLGWGSSIETLILSNNHITNLKFDVFSDLNKLKELSISFNPLMYIDPKAFEGLNNLQNLEISFSLNREEIPDDIFKPLTNLQFLSADNNKFYFLSENSLDHLSNLRFINLEFNEIQSIPKNLFKFSVHKYLTDIRLNNNKISVIVSDTFSNLPELEVILLSSNIIHTVQRCSFSYLSNLEHLILSDNVITKINEHAFANLPLLEKLDLQLNRLTDFHFNYFVNVSNLIQVNVSWNQIYNCEAGKQFLNIEVLDMGHNKISHVPKCLENIGLLRKLYLNSNNISTIESKNFMHLTSLEKLNLNENFIDVIHKHSFAGLQNLQILDLSSNLITQLHNHQFSSLPKLRVLHLGYNKLKYLPKEVLSNTLLEMLDLSYNFFSVVPSLCLAEVGSSLRQLSISWNNIEHVDSTTFPDIPYLQYLNLNKNKLTILPDNVFTSLSLLQKLDISGNPLRANFKELFHYAQYLKELSLANTGINAVPHLPLPNLVSLNLSHNFIDYIEKNSLQNLKHLKYLYLNNNDLSQIPSHLWIHLPYLKVVDLSFNPIKEITSESFYGLQSLQELNINGMKHLKKFDSKSIKKIRILTTLSMQTWPNIEDFSTQLCNMLSNLKQLRILKLHVQESTLDDQLMCISNPKIRHVEISGKHLKVIQPRAFSRFIRNPDLVLKIVNTEIEELPSGLFSSFHRTAHLSIELINNKLLHLSPEVLYVNYSSWKKVGSTSIKGGLVIAENNFICGCHLAWLGHWLRRWARETLQSHNAPIEAAIRMNELLKQTTCVDATINVRKPIVQLPPEDMSCQASALSKAQCLNKTSVIFVFIFLLKFVDIDI
ncbi:hypothetical protein FQR65_LT11420 [Abscondita terminalis]|nr:hypothetical protein FQR65_LT11420 [Abscondita terminalis]